MSIRSTADALDARKDPTRVRGGCPRCPNEGIVCPACSADLVCEKCKRRRDHGCFCVGCKHVFTEDLKFQQVQELMRGSIVKYANVDLKFTHSEHIPAVLEGVRQCPHLKKCFPGTVTLNHAFIVVRTLNQTDSRAWSQLNWPGFSLYRGTFARARRHWKEVLFTLQEGHAPTVAANTDARDILHAEVREVMRTSFYTLRKSHVLNMARWQEYRTQKVLNEPDDIGSWPAVVRHRFRILDTFGSLTRKKLPTRHTPIPADFVALGSFPDELKKLHWTDQWHIRVGKRHPIDIAADDAAADSDDESDSSSGSSVSRASGVSLASVKSSRNKAAEARKAAGPSAGKRK